MIFERSFRQWGRVLKSIRSDRYVLLERLSASARRASDRHGTLERAPFGPHAVELHLGPAQWRSLFLTFTAIGRHVEDYSGMSPIPVTVPTKTFPVHVWPLGNSNGWQMRWDPLEAVGGQIGLT